MSTVQVFMLDRLLVGAPVKYQIRSACEARAVADSVKLTATDWVELATCHLQCWCAVIRGAQTWIATPFTVSVCFKERTMSHVAPAQRHQPKAYPDVLPIKHKDPATITKSTRMMDLMYILSIPTAKRMWINKLEVTLAE